MQHLMELYIYPIKSCQGIQLTQAMVEDKGLQDDRRYMLVDLNGKFITGRTHPQLTQVCLSFSEKNLSVSAPKQPNLAIETSLFSEQMLRVNVWDDNLQAQHCHSDYDQWFSLYLGEPCQLVYFSTSTTRCVKNRETQVSFADGYPLLLINQASVDQLNARLENPVSALHFRPNILIKGAFPFVEDSWSRIKIGDVEFEVSKPCSRCTFINVNPETGIADIEQPLKTLAEFRYHQGTIDFGQNLIPLNSGIIRAGDEIQVLASQAAPFYSALDDSQQQNEKSVTIHFATSNITVTGDNKQLLLEQAERADVNIPYSCRGGKCGRCKTKLLTGEVLTLNNQGLYNEEIEAGYILPCCCIPLSDISIDC